MTKKKVKKVAKRAAKKAFKKLIGRAGAGHPLLANPQNNRHQLMSQNPYLCSLLDPFNCGSGSKIPGFGCMPTATLTVMDRRTLTVNANGVVGAVFQGGMPGLSTSSFGAGWTLSNTATQTNIFANVATAGSGSVAILLGNAATGTTIDATYQDLRLVSASVTMEYTGTTLNDQGLLIAAAYPRESGNYSWPITATPAINIRNSPYAREVAVNKHKGIAVRYNPTDADSYVFSRTGNRGYQLPAATIDGVLWNFSDAFGSMMVMGIGLAAGQTVNIVSAYNYEAHPEASSTTIVSSSPSHSDPLAMSHAETEAYAFPQVTEGLPSIPKGINVKMNSVATVSQPVNKPSFVEKLLTVANRALPLIGPAGQALEGFGLEGAAGVGASLTGAGESLLPLLGALAL
jgi:hypothetical protein